MHIHQTSAVETVAKLQSGELNAEHLFKSQQDRIQKLNSQYNAFAHVEANPQTAKLDGPLAGLPISVKDQIHVANMPCTSGYEPLKAFIPEEDAPVVATLKEAGAQILGKTNLPPMAMDFQTYNKLHGCTRNPWNTKFTAGGSTGGGAAAVAAGLSFIEIGADLAGSLRIPASFCGVCSLMPTVEQLPMQGSMTLLEQAGVSLDYLPRIGPIGRHVEDLALIWQVLNGTEPLAKSTAKHDVRIALLPETDEIPLHPQIRRVFSEVIQHLTNQPNVKLETQQPSDFDWQQAWHAYGIIQGHQIGAMLSPFQRFMSRLLSQGAMRRSPNFIKPIQDGYKCKQAAFDQALATRERLAGALDTFLAQYDCWILPVTLVPAFEHIEASYEQGFVRDYKVDFEFDGYSINYFEALTRLTIPFNLTGHPVVTVPVGKDSNSGVPIGLQFVGRKNRENELLETVSLIMKLLPSWTHLEL